MTMIGLFTGAPQVTATSSATDDKQGAEGFGSAMQDVLSALAGPGADTSAGETPADTTGGNSTERADALTLVAAPPTVAVPQATLALDETLSLAEPVEATPKNSTLPLVELVETLPTNNALPLAEATPLVEPVEHRTQPVEVTVPSGSALSAEVEGLSVGEVATSAPRPGTAVSPVSPGDSTPTDVATPLKLVESPPSSEEADVLPPAAGSGAGEVTSAGSVPGSTRSTGEEGSTVGVGSLRGESSLAGATSTTPMGSAALPVELVKVALPSGAALSEEPGVVPAAAEVRAGEVISADSASGALSASTGSSSRESASTPIPQPAAAPIGTPLPTGSVAPVAPTSAPAAPAAAVPTASIHFGAQLAKPIFSLASAGAGEHVMTVSVTPDNLGPVTVRAHVGAEGVRVELFAPSDLGRDAIRAILPDLRRDLAGAGLGGNLNLSSQDSPTEQFGAGEGGNPRGDGSRATEPGQNAEGAPAENVQRRPSLYGTTSTIDVLA